LAYNPEDPFLATRLADLLEKQYQIKDLKLGLLDITFYRDDFRRREEPLAATSTELDFLIEGKKVVFIDDVLFSGRSIRAALTAIQSYGRPENIELLVLIDRRFSRHLPIQPNYKGRQVDAINEEKVLVTWKETHNKDAVYIDNN
jgi:pyrimidine operon attenuation protein/uracil phosphoribosyltransferase